MYQTEKLLRAQLQVRYLAGRGRIVLRTELDRSNMLALMTAEGVSDAYPHFEDATSSSTGNWEG